MRLGPERQPLPQLPQVRVLQSLLQLGLTYENNLQKLLGESLEIRHHANFFEHFIGQVLRFIND